MTKDQLKRMNQIRTLIETGQSTCCHAPVEVFIKTEDRTIMSYIVKPITDQITHAMRER